MMNHVGDTTDFDEKNIDEASKNKAWSIDATLHHWRNVDGDLCIDLSGVCRAALGLGIFGTLLETWPTLTRA